MAWFMLSYLPMVPSAKYRCVFRKLGCISAVAAIMITAMLTMAVARAETSSFSNNTSTRRTYWQVETTANFRVFHNDAVISPAVARMAEKLQSKQLQL